MNLKDILIKEGFVCIKLYSNSIGHFQFTAEINGVEGEFILDTGASASCVGTEFADMFNLKTSDKEVEASGAGNSDMKAFVSDLTEVKISGLKIDIDEIVLFNLTEINSALKKHGASLVHGVIGADILKQHKAIINYHDQTLYLNF
ncbi:MAG: clan AA aspartic protease [Ichthyobacteriaceae bacterium]|nr:clan AA aspartic protease [Ichthyobacteriaceae bacterium]